MRSDTANLLERLGRRDFHYREFADSFADIAPVPPAPRQKEESLFSRYAMQPSSTPGTPPRSRFIPEAPVKQR